MNILTYFGLRFHLEYLNIHSWCYTWACMRKVFPFNKYIKTLVSTTCLHSSNEQKEKEEKNTLKLFYMNCIHKFSISFSPPCNWRNINCPDWLLPLLWTSAFEVYKSSEFFIALKFAENSFCFKRGTSKSNGASEAFLA